MNIKGIYVEEDWISKDRKAFFRYETKLLMVDKSET